MEKIVSLCKRRGFLYPSSEIYGGFSGFWDYGPYGADLVYNLKDLWWKRFVKSREDMYGISSSIIMPEPVWQASGHLKNFTDPLVECKKCHHRFRADHLEDKKKCPDCEGELGEEKAFNTMFPVETGSLGGSTSKSYLRGELAQGMFVNFKNIIDSFHPSIPFGIAQIGKAFRNEISPRDFIYRVREFEIAEFEYFIKEDEWEKYFEYWRKEMLEWLDEIGIDRKNVKENDLKENERAHYSKRTIDFEYQGSIGDMEIQAIAYRTDYDLKNHMEGSGVDLSYRDETSNEKFIPHVIEPTWGVDRSLLVAMLEAYREEEAPTSEEGESATRIVMKFPKWLAPVKIAILPLSKKEELSKIAKPLYEDLSKKFVCEYDETQSIGKRYRRQDEIGTPYCVTVDFETAKDDSVTVRDRDTMKQERIKISELENYLSKNF